MPSADLELSIQLDRNVLYFILNSRLAGYHFSKVGETELRCAPLEKMQAKYSELSNLARPISNTLGENSNAESRLTVIGNELWTTLIPEELKRQYWRFKPLVRSILITSDEPWIPWEIIKPFRFSEDTDQKEDHPHWCQTFAMSRWLSGVALANELKVGSMRPVAPTQTSLPSVHREIEFVSQLNTLHSGISTLEPFSNRIQVLNWIGEANFSMLHFACHGMFNATLPEDSGIELSDGFLRPSDLQIRFSNRTRPLVFINACHGARMEFSLTGLGGWATQLVKAHVSSFVGAMWEVNDALALEFARHFYTFLLRENRTIAESFQAAREQIRQIAPHNSTWLAYTLYADPQGKYPLEPAPNLKILLLELQRVLEENPSLSTEDRIDALKQLLILAKAGNNPKQAAIQRTARIAVTMLREIIATLPNGSTLAELGQIILAKVSGLLGVE